MILDHKDLERSTMILFSRNTASYLKKKIFTVALHIIGQKF